LGIEIYKGPEADKVKSMFSKVADGYDLANNILSLGIHHLWRKKVVKLAQAKQNDHVLDCATGTGDLAMEFKKIVGEQGVVIGTDFCQEMLDHAPAKAMQHNLSIRFEVADVTQLPYQDKSFDIASISFGIRNVQDPTLGLKEMARVVKSGGTVVVLEFGQMRLPLVSTLYKFYSEKVLPRIGGMVTGQTKAYEYLQASSAKFPDREQFLAMMNATGSFAKTTYSTLSGGIAYIYIGKVK
jgi:demethylmenaquinone methyltransferase / 2-methoxy-6-polyprenyl-1,4-benzoquinol methylase